MGRAFALRVAVAALAVWTLGCGARSGLELPPGGGGGAGGGTSSTHASSTSSASSSSSESSSSSASAGGGCTVPTTTPVRLAKEQGGVFDVAADTSFAYWANVDAGRVSKVSRCDGTVTVLATEQIAPFAIAVDADTLYFSTQTTDGGVRRIPLAGGAPSSIWSGGQVEGLVVDDENVYFAVVAADDESKMGVWSIGKQGAGPKQLYSGMVTRALAIDPSDVYFCSFEATPFLARTPKSGGPIAHVAKIKVHGSIAVDATSAYISTWDLSPTNLTNIIAYPKAGGPPTALASGSDGPVVGVAALADGVAWTDQGGLVRFIAFSGGSPVTIASNQKTPERIVAVDGVLFWADYNESSVWMAPAP